MRYIVKTCFYKIPDTYMCDSQDSEFFNGGFRIGNKIIIFKEKYTHGISVCIVEICKLMEGAKFTPRPLNGFRIVLLGYIWVFLILIISF